MAEDQGAPGDGETVRRDAQGSVVERATFRGGLLHGPFRLYAPGGGLLREAFHADGRAEGLATDYDDAGLKLAETTWRAGVRDGPARLFRDGRLMMEMAWRDGALDGPLVAYHDGGAVAAVIPHRAGRPHGVVETFAPTGERQTAVAMEDGLRHGLSLVFDPDGREIERTEWVRGAPASAAVGTPAAGKPDATAEFYAALAAEGARRQLT
jgi:antitoxin component YwqK of YwqJK toxin-antitoxin module